MNQSVFVRLKIKKEATAFLNLLLLDKLHVTYSVGNKSKTYSPGFWVDYNEGLQIWLCIRITREACVKMQDSQLHLQFIK